MQSIEVEEPKPIEEDGKGSIDFSLEIPGDAAITGSFNIELPEGYTLDEATTLLSEALSEFFRLIITSVSNNTWQIEIVPNGLRAAYTLPEYTKIMTIGYIVDTTVEAGNYSIELKDINLMLDDGTPIEQASIVVVSEVTRDATSLSPMRASNICVYSTQGGIVVENAPAGEIIHIYNVSGVLVAEKQWSESSTIMVSKGIYLVKVGRTTTKVVVN